VILSCHLLLHDHNHCLLTGFYCFYHPKNFMMFWLKSDQDSVPSSSWTFRSSSSVVIRCDRKYKLCPSALCLIMPVREVRPHYGLWRASLLQRLLGQRVHDTSSRASDLRVYTSTLLTTNPHGSLDTKSYCIMHCKI